MRNWAAVPARCSVHCVVGRARGRFHRRFYPQWLMELDRLRSQQAQESVQLSPPRAACMAQAAPVPHDEAERLRQLRALAPA